MADVIWSWRPTTTPALRRNCWIAGSGITIASAASLAVAVTTPSRFVIVLTFLLAGIGVFWWLEHRRFRATEVSLDAAGALRVDDGRTSASIDLASVDSVAVRLRTQPGLSVFTATPKWTIELSGDDDTVTHPIAHAAGLFNPAREDIEGLEAELTVRVRRANAEPVPSGAAPNTASDPADQPMSPQSVLGVDAANAAAEPSRPVQDDGPFEWRPPVSPHAARRRRLFRVAYGVAAGLVAVIGVVVAWGDWVGVVLSAVTVPGLILACCGGLDWALGRGRRFRLFVEDGVLHVEPASGQKRIRLDGSSVTIDRNAHLVSTGSSTMRTTSWMLTVTASDGTTLKQMLPGFGTATTEADYVALERALQRRT